MEGNLGDYKVSVSDENAQTFLIRMFKSLTPYSFAESVVTFIEDASYENGFDTGRQLFNVIASESAGKVAARLGLTSLKSNIISSAVSYILDEGYYQVKKQLDNIGIEGLDSVFIDIATMSVYQEVFDDCTYTEYPENPDDHIFIRVDDIKRVDLKKQLATIEHLILSTMDHNKLIPNDDKIIFYDFRDGKLDYFNSLDKEKKEELLNNVKNVLYGNDDDEAHTND